MDTTLQDCRLGDLLLQPWYSARTAPVWVISDIVAVNGKPAKGTMVERVSILHLSPTAPPGDTIADTFRTGLYDFNFEIQQADGTPIGSIRSGGVGGGAPPPGAIKAVAVANHPILGGTGAFLGVRGYQGSPPASPAGNNMTLARTASFSEDPANRRILGGGPAHHTLYIIPMFWPKILTTRNGPAIVHASDYALVTTAKPAESGEILTLFATGLGPTRPGLELGDTFTAAPLQVANSPVDVTVNGAAAEVLYAGGYPGTTNTYQVDFRLPSGITSGTASLQITAAWIGGPEVKIPVQ